jgi:hypothetical protein
MALHQWGESEAQSATPRRPLLTVVGVSGHGDDPHGLVGYVRTQHLGVPSRELVGAQHCPPGPVRPEDEVSVDGQAEEGPGP